MILEIITDSIKREVEYTLKSSHVAISNDVLNMF